MFKNFTNISTQMLLCLARDVSNGVKPDQCSRILRMCCRKIHKSSSIPFTVSKKTLENDYDKIKIAGLGNPFETTVRRRREVQDPSRPNHDSVECLKWTNWRMLRDLKRRHIHAAYHQHRNNLKNLEACKILPSVIRDIARDERQLTPRDSSVNKLVNRCALSSRPRGNLQQYRLSRIIWRDQADHGLLSGPIRAKWG